MFKKLKFVAVLLMAAWLGGTNVLLAQSREWNRETDNGGNSEGYRLVPNANGRIPIPNTITLTGNLTLRLVDDVDCSIRNNSGGNLFIVPNGCKLTIIGKEGHKVELHGQASFIYAENPTAFQQKLETTTGRGFNSNTKNNGALIKCAGALELTDVVVTNNYNTNATMYNDAGGIHIYNAEGDPKNVTLTRVTIQRCHSSSTGGAMRIHGGKLGNVKMTNCEIKQCSNWTGTTVDGGTIRTNGGCSAKFVMNGCTVHNNYSNGNGGAFWWNAYGDGGTATIKNSTFYNNYSRNDGGALFNTGAGFSVQGCTIYNNTAYNDGGGIYCRNYIRTGNGEGNVTLDANCDIYGNTAGQHGGGVGLGLMAVEEGFTPVHLTMTLNFNGAKVHNNTAKYGGGLSMVRTDDLPAQYQAYFNLTSGNLYDNTATVQGGGAYLTGGIHNSMSGGSIGRGADGNVYANSAPNGGGFYISGGESSVSGAECVGNKASTGNGGGFFVTGGNITLSSGSIISNTASNGNGGGLYVQGGLSTISGGTVQNNIATNGAGLYMEGTSSSSLATATFANGTFQNNVASGNGGGIYLASNSALTMSGTSHIMDNHVSNVSGHGGGVMVNGGQFIIIGGTGSSLDVDGNYVGESTNNSNNVYLNGANDYITIDKDHGTLTGIKVGISINGNDIPKKVVFCENSDILNAISGMITEALETGGDNSIFDDAHRYEPLISAEAPYEDKFLYFVRTWSVGVTEAELDELVNMGDIKYIDTPKKLAAFMMLANGFKTGFDGSNMKGVITADLEMDGSLWIPIGGAKDATSGNSIPFTGSMDGGGHVISNLISVGLMNYNDYGLFGKTDGAEIKNIVIENCNFVSGEARRMGALICDMKGGTVENCIASGKVIASGSETYPVNGVYEELYCVVGGLIGEVGIDEEHPNATITNCMSTVEVEALPKEPVSMYPRSQKITVGGLVGKTSSGTVIRNSYAHAKISHKCETRIGIEGSGYNDPTPLGRYVGGLVGINNGEITNCYVRFQEGTQLDLGEGTNNSSLFGMFAGNNAGTISYCYAPDNTLFSTSRSYVHTQAESPSTLNNYGDFNTTVTPYYYKHHDNLVTMNGASATSGSLLDKLNAWVGNNATCSHWMRTCASPVNGDYPVLRYDNDGLAFTTIASRDGIDMEYNKSLNAMLDKYKATGNAVFVYETPTDSVKVGSSIPMYVGEDVALMLKKDIVITNAYVGITLDNSAASKPQFNWHMFATPLANAPLGVNYTDNEEHNYWEGDVLPHYSFYAENVEDGYFPSKTFGTNADYYDDWDYYCYSEPDYQWINFKRNSASHFHQDTENPLHPNHEQISYDNEATLSKGKGYLLATKEATFLQSHGTLNNGDVEITLSKTDDVQPYFQGYNLIGNPYQSYLDFSKTGLGSYVILDEDAGGYVAYTIGASKNAYPASSSAKDGGEVPAPGQYLHMHQGFFVVAASDGQTVTLSPEMCDAKASSTFRGEEQPAYPLVNLAVTEADGSREFVTIELDRPDNGGAAKMKGLRNGTGLIYTSIDGEDYSIAFMPVGTTSAAVRFETLEGGTFTMNWNTQNGTFSYLHLIDNLTGMDIDCLASDEYKFTASPDDYASRFKLVFSYTGVEENEAASTGSASFAFMMNGNLVVNGEGVADIFDLTGRLVSSTRLVGVQSTISLPSMAQGIYTIRLTDGNGSKVQKVVIK